MATLTGQSLIESLGSLDDSVWCTCPNCGHHQEIKARCEKCGAEI